MKTVTLFRHAKSGEKNNPLIDDFDRPLSSRGLKAASKMGLAMREHGIRANLILCSPSVRTRQTLSLAAAVAWDNSPRLKYDASLYDASANTLLRVLQALPEDAAHAMLVGHNPGLQELAFLVAKSESPHRPDLKTKFPTASLAVFDCEVEHWREVEPGCGEVRLFIAPNTL